MKNKKKLLTVFGAMLFCLSGCMEGGTFSPEGGAGTFDDYYSGGSKTGGEKTSTTDGDDTSTSDVIAGQENQENVAPRQLTAKALFDNNDSDYEYFCSLIKDDYQMDGRFAAYQNQFKLDYDRVKVTVKDTPYAHVELLNDDEETLWESVADANGVCYLFSNERGSKVKVTVGEESRVYDVEHQLEITDFASQDTHEKIQILLNIDTTGSMSDEIKYLKAELTDVVERIEDQTGADAEIGILAYRDRTDEYLVIKQDFTDDIDEALTYLNGLAAKGGGDTPEAVEKAYQESMEFTWKEDATKVVVHVADAPSHDEDVKKWFGYVENLSQMGARILSVASSGIDLKTEFLFRMQSLQTNGCYAYLTDDSGIGGFHLQALTEDEIVTEYLNDLLVRVIKGFHKGTFDEPVPYNQEIYNALLEFNPNCGISKSSQAMLATKYVGQMSSPYNGTQKASVENIFYVGNSYVVLRMNDNFTDVLAEKRIDTVNGCDIESVAGKHPIYVFDGTKFYSIAIAYDHGVIRNYDISKIKAAIEEQDRAVEQ